MARPVTSKQEREKAEWSERAAKPSRQEHARRARTKTGAFKLGKERSRNGTHGVKYY